MSLFYPPPNPNLTLTLTLGPLKVQVGGKEEGERRMKNEKLPKRERGRGVVGSKLGVLEREKSRGIYSKK